MASPLYFVRPPCQRTNAVRSTRLSISSGSKLPGGRALWSSSTLQNRVPSESGPFLQPPNTPIPPEPSSPHQALQPPWTFWKTPLLTNTSRPTSPKAARTAFTSQKRAATNTTAPYVPSLRRSSSAAVIAVPLPPQTVSKLHVAFSESSGAAAHIPRQYDRPLYL